MTAVAAVMPSIVASVVLSIGIYPGDYLNQLVGRQLAGVVFAQGGIMVSSKHTYKVTVMRAKGVGAEERAVIVCFLFVCGDLFDYQAQISCSCIPSMISGRRTAECR